MSTVFETKAIPGQLNVDQAEGIVECFVAGIGNKDSVGDIVLPGAFDASLKRRKPRVVWGHDWNHPIGRVLEIYEVGPNDRRLPGKMRAAKIGGLFAKVQFNLKSERGREAFANVSFFGPEQEWSIGYKTLQAVYDNTRQANLLKEVELYEVSPVLHGANQLTGTISIKSDNGDDERVTSFKKSKWPMFDRAYAERIKNEHPDIWDKGGNIKGDDQYTILTRIAEQGGVAKTEDQIAALELREAWIARHLKDFRLPGVVAQIKWLAVGSRGESYMKGVIREAISGDREEKGHGYGWMEKPDDDDNNENEMVERLNEILSGYAAERQGSSDDDPREELEDIAESAGMSNPAMGRQAVLARALANELRSPVKIRTMTANTVVFDVMDPTDPDDITTMRASWHAERGEVMIGKPERVRVETVYIPVQGGEGEGYVGDEQIKQEVCDCGCMSGKKNLGRTIGGSQRSGQGGGEIDRDGDGVIFDGTPDERPAPRRRSASRKGSDGERWDAALGRGEYQKIFKREMARRQLGADANRPSRWKFNDEDGHTTLVEEDGSGSIRHRDGGDVYSYGAFDDPAALNNVPKNMRKKLQRMRAHQWARNRVSLSAQGKAVDEEDFDLKVDPRAGIPQERFTGDVLRGYGPRRGNLERLLRYWRPIMRKPGGFRRCLVILADHPELYPLENICAWLHHETTGLWPNEGCHHPGMKNCRRKLRGVTRGSLWSNDEFNSRMRKLRERSNDGKGMDWDWDEEKGEYGDVTDEDVKYANRVLNEFLMQEKEFAAYLSDEKNWMHVGSDQNETEIEHEWVKPDGYEDKPSGCGCGCAGKGSCSPYKSVEDSLEELREKVGRSLNSRNAQRISEAIRLLTEVIGGAPEPSMERKGDGGLSIAVPVDHLFEMREIIDPIVEYYGLDVEVDEEAVHVKGELHETVLQALENAVNGFSEIETKDF